MPFCGLIPPRASCDLFFLGLKRGASVVRASSEKRDVRDCCTSDLIVFDLIEAWSQSALKAGFFHQ